MFTKTKVKLFSSYSVSVELIYLKLGEPQRLLETIQNERPEANYVWEVVVC